MTDQIDSDFAEYTRKALQNHIDRCKETGSTAIRFFFAKNNDGGAYWRMWQQHYMVFVNELREQGHTVDVNGVQLVITPYEVNE